MRLSGDELETCPYCGNIRGDELLERHYCPTKFEASDPAEDPAHWVDFGWRSSPHKAAELFCDRDSSKYQHRIAVILVRRSGGHQESEFWTFRVEPTQTVRFDAVEIDFI